jgi:uncharacterized protein YprB with RNaseH-like and TPR domain
MTGPRILTIDIETSPNVADVWSLWDQTISLNQLHETSRVISFAAKWHGEPKVIFSSEFHHGHDAMVANAHKLLDASDWVIHFNGTSFDIPHLQREFLLADMPPPAPFRQIDLLRVVKGRFKFPSYKLQHVSTRLGLEGKTTHEGHGLWTKCMAGDPKAWALMKRYNKQDVILTEKLYDRLRPWIKQHPHIGLFNPDASEGCGRCGSQSLEKRGYAYTATAMYQQYRCRGCGSWSRGGKAINRMDIRGIA